MNLIKIGIGVPSIGRFPPYIAQAAGLFERQGLNVEVVNQKDEEKAVRTSLPVTHRSARPMRPH